MTDRDEGSEREALTIGEVLDEEFNRRGLSRKEVASRVDGLEVEALHGQMSGRLGWDANLLARICLFLEIDVYELLTLHDTKNEFPALRAVYAASLAKLETVEREVQADLEENAALQKQVDASEARLVEAIKKTADAAEDGLLKRAERANRGKPKN